MTHGSSLLNGHAISPLGPLATATATDKGTIVAIDASDQPTEVKIGDDGYVLTADSTQAAGVKWAAGGGSGSGLTHPQILARSLGA